MKYPVKCIAPLLTLIFIGAGCGRGVTTPAARPPVVAPAAPAPVTSGPCPLTEALVREHCTVISPLVTTEAPFARCVISIKPGIIPIPLIALFERPWLPNQRALATTNVPTLSETTVMLPSWDVAGLGDLAFITPFFDPTDTLATLESGDGFNLYIKTGDLTHHLVSYGRATTGTADLCGIDATKALAQDILGE
ncbi:hypothetical protein HY478_02740 [Candidatus Uhrbacteria bacterium]|nr:hypothetical protein [Candidatus Uhrbacteria bacterium]